MRERTIPFDAPEGGDSGEATHVVTKPNRPTSGARAISPIDEFKQYLVGDYQAQVMNYFRGDKERTMKFMSSVVHSLRNVKGLIDCDRQSILNAFMTCAQLEMYPSQFSGEAYVLPYKGEAKFQIGYQGLVTLFYRAGVEAVDAKIVCKNDKFEYQEGLNPILEHKPDVFGDRGEPIGVYAIGVINGGNKIFTVMSKAQVMKIKEFSKSKDSKFTPWDPKNDPELWMWRKTALKQLAKFLPKNETLHRAIALDNKDSVIEDRKEALDAGGIATSRVSHRTEAIAPPSDPEKCKAGKHHIDYQDEEGNCTECAKGV